MPEGLPQKPANAVSAHSIEVPAGDNKAGPHRTARGRKNSVDAADQTPVQPSTILKDTLKCAPAAKDRLLLQPYRSSLTVSFRRPWARLRESTLRPVFVAMRARNPCVFFRFRRCG